MQVSQSILVRQLSARRRVFLVLMCVCLAAMQWVAGLHAATARIATLKTVVFNVSATTESQTSLHDQLFFGLEAHNDASRASDDHPTDTQNCSFLDAHFNADTCSVTPLVVALHDVPPLTHTTRLPQRISRFLALGKQARAPPAA